MKIKAIIFDLGNTLIQQKVDSEKTLAEMELKLLPGVKQVLEDLSKNYPLALLTNTTQSTQNNVKMALVKLSIDKYFKTIVTSFDVGIEKPALKMFDTVLNRLQVKPWDTLMVGNDIRQDMYGARQAGMFTAYYIRGDLKQDDNADLNFRSFEDLPKLISSLERRNE
jgi:putative hydrolase of the HAD superfamily